MGPAVQCSKHVENIKDKKITKYVIFFPNTMIKLYSTRGFLLPYQKKNSSKANKMKWINGYFIIGNPAAR